MTTRVLVPMDDSEMAEKALLYAFDLHPEAEITVLHVVGEPSMMMGKATGLAMQEDFEEVAKEHASVIFDRAKELAADHDVELETVIGFGSPAKVILNRAEDFDAVVVGTHGGSLADRLLVGNVTEKVFRRSPVPVTVVR